MFSEKATYVSGARYYQNVIADLANRQLGNSFKLYIIIY